MRNVIVRVAALSSIVASASCSSPAAIVPPDGIHCAQDSECSGTKPRCDKSSGKCVQCVPTNDDCPSGSHCALVNSVFMCSTSCRNNADCSAAGGGSARTCCGGACLDATADIKNCGACGMVCPPPSNATPTCSAGKCGLGACNMGFGNCDNNAVNGCETALTSDLMNCSMCGAVCPQGVHGTSACKMSSCSIACDAGFLHCSNNAADGCEINGTNDSMNCGACGKACPLANACVKGQCALQLVSDTSWKQAQNAPNGWEQPGFNDAQWAAAVDEGAYGVAPWGQLAPFDALNTPARWLWYYASNSGDDMATVYFRRSFVASGAGATLTVSGDNTFMAYVDGMMVSMGSDWTMAQQVAVGTKPGHTYVLAITVTNQGGPGGLLVDLR